MPEPTEFPGLPVLTAVSPAAAQRLHMVGTRLHMDGRMGEWMDGRMEFLGCACAATTIGPLSTCPGFSPLLPFTQPTHQPTLSAPLCTLILLPSAELQATLPSSHQTPPAAWGAAPGLG